MTEDERALIRLQGFCRICDESGCWEWTGGYTGVGKLTPIFHFPGSRKNRRSMQAYKAAWLLFGKQPPPQGYCVYRKHCLNFKCVNPEHLGIGTRKMIGAHIVKRGTRKGVPARIVANQRKRGVCCTPEPVIRQVETMLANGVTRKDICAELGIGTDIVTQTKQGRHFHSANRPKLIRGASVFALA